MAALDGSLSETELDGTDPLVDNEALNEVLSVKAQDTALLSLEEAQAKLPPEVLQVLAEKFKGSLTQVRHRDERDQIF
ncbi:MAG: hypothetical protein EA353_14405 [Puniceicoccaceae bacterium]|nr:MAG: hypothetical protein EA353_14405 [Puniceicoccaceae bacterium]